jgi:hypothetical protein
VFTADQSARESSALVVTQSKTAVCSDPGFSSVEMHTHSRYLVSAPGRGNLSWVSCPCPQV